MYLVIKEGLYLERIIEGDNTFKFKFTRYIEDACKFMVAHVASDIATAIEILYNTEDVQLHRITNQQRYEI